MEEDSKLQKTSYYGEGYSEKEIVQIMDKYHFWEKKDPAKNYNNKKFEMDYGYGFLNYIYINIIINDTHYVAAEEELSNDELTKLKPYCSCDYCDKHWLNPMKYLVCRCCTGCLSSSFPSQYCINKAREKFNSK